MSGINLPVAATPPEAPAIKLQAARAEGPSGWTTAIEKLGSRQSALKERRAAERISDRLSVVKTPLESRPIALRQTPAAAKPLANSSPAWTKAVEKLRSRQTLLERAATTDVAGTLNRMRDALRRDASMGARLALPPQDL
jgi:hypothetical protein